VVAVGPELARQRPYGLKGFDLDKAFASRVGICSGFARGRAVSIRARIDLARARQTYVIPKIPMAGMPSLCRTAWACASTANRRGMEHCR